MKESPAFPTVDRKLLDDVIARIRSVGDPQRVVLFGSHAHGRGRPDSDLDLLIVEDSDLPRHRRAPRYLRALAGVFPAKDVIVWTPSEIAEWSRVPHAFISTILREGVTLYER